MNGQGYLRNLALMLSDACCICVSWAVSVWGYQALGFGHYRYGCEFYLSLWPAAVVFLLINALFRLYQGHVFAPGAPVGPVEELRRLVGSAVVTHMGVLAALALAYQSTEHYSRVVVVLSGVLTALADQPLRNLMRAAMKKAAVGQIPVHVLGSAEEVGRIVREWAEDSYVGFASASLDEPAEIAVLADPGTVSIAELFGRYRQIEFASSGVALPLWGARVVSVGERGAVEVINQRKLRILRAEKRLLDGILAVFAFALTLPVSVLIALGVKLTSRGPVFYRQRRLGKMGRPIRVWKFRTMHADADRRLERMLASDPVRKAEWERNFKLTDDPRVTAFGRLLRKLSLDELPQILNVFSGEMALVGPRPIVAEEVPRYDSAYDLFSSVRPGITGLWQVSGRSDTDYPRRIALDTQYILNWSPWMDFWILMRTVGAVLLMRGAR